MSSTQPLLYSDWTILRQPIARRLAFALVAMIVGTLLFFPARARAQVPTSLVTLATDQMQLNPSNHFGVPSGSIVDQAGDLAFIGEGGSALFLRVAGATSATRLLQFGDPVPNLTGATIVDFAGIGGLNASAHLLFAVDYNVIPVDGRLHRAILLYTGGTSYTTIATSDLTAPGTGVPGTAFGPSLTFPGGANSNGALDNNNDVVFESTLQPFAGTATAPNQDTIYIAPAAGTPVRVVGLGDLPTGAPAPLVNFVSVRPINTLGQIFFDGEFANTSTPAYGLFLASVSGVTKVVVTGDSKPSLATGSFTISSTTTFALNNSGQAAFVDPGTPASQIEPGIWFYSSGTITNIYTSPLPNSGVSTTVVQLSALSDLGEAVALVSPGLGSSGSFIARVHSSNDQVDTVALNGQSAPGISGATFQSFSALSTDTNDRVTFFATSAGGPAIYQQTGTATPQLIALGGQTAPVSGGGTFVLNSVTRALNNGSTFFSSIISGGTATYGQFVGTPVSISALMSTADTLPAGARLRISNPKWTGGNQGSNELYLAFDANLAGGESALYERDIVAGVTTRIVGEGDILSALGGTAFFQRSTPSGVKPYYMNDYGQIAFPAMLTNGTGAILLAQPTGGFTVIASTGQTAPLSGSPTFTSFDFSSNTTSLSPINDSGQVAFYGTLSTAVVGIFLGDGNELANVAYTGETVPEGGATFSSSSSLSTCGPCSLALNNNGQVAFGANKSSGSGIYIYTGGTLLNVAYSAEAEPQGSGGFGALDPISGFNDSGKVVFEPQGGGGGGGVYEGTVGLPSEVAIAGAAAPGTGAGTLSTDTPNFEAGSFLNFFVTANAAIDDCGDVAFQSKVTGGTANSGYFGIVGNQCSGGASGSLQAFALQGQVVSGAGTLGTMFTSSASNSFFALGNNDIGELWFTNSYTTTGGATMVGQFLATSAGTVQKLLAPGDAISGTGGVYAQATPAPITNGQDDVSLYEVLTTGGTASQALVLAVEEGGTISTSTTVTSSQSPSGIGVPVTFTATVTSTSGTPAAGDFVVFFDNGVTIGIGLLNGSQQATFTTLSLTAGSHSISAEYFPNSGSNNNNSSENLKLSISPAITQTVSNATTTELFSLTNPSLPGQSVEFEAIVFATAGSTLFPTGTVNFFDGATQIGTGTLADEVVTFSTSSLSTTTHVITAQYSGDSNFAAGTSNPVDQVVGTTGPSGPLPSATALASSVNPSFSGQSVTFVAPVDGGSGGTPTGTVNFLDGATSIGTGPVVTTAQGTQATFTTSSLSIGAHSITAVYSGNSSFAGSTSNVVIQTVTTGAQTSSIAPRFAYATNEGSNSVSAYTVDAVTGALTPVPGSPFATGSGSEPFAVAADPSGRFVYVANWGTNTVSVFSVNTTTGILTPVTGSPFATGGSEPAALAVDPGGRFVYVAHENGTNNVAVLSVNATTGALTPVSGSPFASGGQFSFSVSADPEGRFIYVANYSSSNVSVFSVNGTTGALTAAPGSPFSTGTETTPGSVIADPTGQYVYVANECTNCAGTVDAFSVNGTTGALTAVPGSPFTPGGTGPVSVSVGPGDQFVYVASYNSSTVSVFSVDATTGALVQVPSSPFATGGTNPLSVSADPSGKFVYVGNSASGNVSVFSIAGATGALTAVPGSPFTSGSNTWSVAAFGTASSPSATLISLTVQPGTASILVDSTQQFTAIGTYSDGSTRFLTSSATWFSSDGTATVSNTPGSAGLATGVAQGSPTIFASFNGVTSSSASLTVSAVLLSITVTPATSSIAVGNTQAFAAIGTFSDGTMIDVTPSVTWSSTQTQFATINGNGVASAVKPGTTMITAQMGIVTSGPASLTVSSATLSSIAVTPINPFTTELTQQPFTATGTYSDGSVADLTSRVTWQSSASGTASISESGVASTGESTGTTTISATLGAVSNSTTLTVVQNEASPKSFNLAFYANNGPAEGVSGNIEDYDFNFGGTFQIASTALGVPNNLVLYRDPALLQFDAPIYTDSNFFDFNLGNESVFFPGDAYPFNDGNKTDPVQGLRMDSSGNALRFDTPSTLSGTSAVIRFFNGQTPTAGLTLVDNDAFNYVMLSDGTLLQRTALDGQTPVGNVGNWTFNGGPGDGTIYSGVYVIYPVAAITSASSAAFTVGTNGTFTVTSVGYPTSSLSEAGTLPNGVSFQDNHDGTGTLHGMPAVGSAGTYPITLTANNEVDPNFTQNFTLTVTTSALLSTNTGLTSLRNPSSFGQSVTFTATVTDSAEVPPNGNVTFIDNTADSQLGSVALIGGVATFSTSSLSSGSHSVTASYSGDGANFLGSTSLAVTQVVQPVLNPSNTILTSSLNPAAFGQSVVLTAIVYSSVAGTPTGTVRFMDNSTETVLGTGTLSNGLATLTTSSLPLGSNSIQAIYLGDSNFQTSTSAAVQQMINHGPTSTAVASSLNPAAGGQSVQFSAIVTSSTGETPTGTVTFFDGEASLGTGTLNASGIATFSTSSLGVGAHSITAQYPNGAIFNGSTSAPLTETITLNLTTTAIISSLNPSPSTDFVQFSAIVTSVSGGTPAGTVNFEDNTSDVQIGSAQLNASGVATFGTSSLAIGTHSITAQYVGNASFGGSTSSPVVQSVTINATPTTAPTFISIASVPNPSAVGQTVVITATVSSSKAGTPTGNITFLDNGVPIGVMPLATGSLIATFSTSTLSAGSHPLTAQYSGDANYALSLSAVLSQAVGSGSTQATTVQVTPIPQNVAPATQVVAPCPSIGEYCQQFTATVQNGGASPSVTWAVLAGPGTIDVNTGFYSAPSNAPTTQVTISATVGGSSASISFTLGADALTSPQTPATVAAGTPLAVTVQLAGVPTNSTIPFVLSCGSLPVATTCTFSNNSPTPAGCPMGTITSVTGACPNFTVTVNTSGGTSGSTRLMPAPDERGRPWQGGPWYGLFAIVMSAVMSALVLTKRRRGVLLGSRSYACCVLVLLCVCVMFLSSCGAFFQSTNSVPTPALVPLTPSGSYQVVVLATPPGGSAGGGFVQTQLIVPVIVN